MQYVRESGEGGLFVEYIDTFLNLKAEASGYYGWVHSPEDEDRYVDSFWQRESITLPNGVWPNYVSTPCGANCGERRSNNDLTYHGTERPVRIPSHPRRLGDEPRICQRRRSVHLLEAWKNILQSCTPM